MDGRANPPTLIHKASIIKVNDMASPIQVATSQFHDVASVEADTQDKLPVQASFRAVVPPLASLSPQAALAPSDFTKELRRVPSNSLLSPPTTPRDGRSKIIDLNEPKSLLEVACASIEYRTLNGHLEEHMFKDAKDERPPEMEFEKLEQPTKIEGAGEEQLTVSHLAKNEGGPRSEETPQIQSEESPVTDNGEQLFLSRMQDFSPRRSLDEQSKYGSDFGFLLLWDAMEFQYNPLVPADRKKRFLPKQKLYEMINEVFVKRELSRYFPESEVIAMTSQICQLEEKKPYLDEEGRYKGGPLRNIFAILLLNQVPFAIKEFIRGRVCDLDLPFHEIDGSDLDVDQIMTHLGRKNDLVPIRDMFDTWTQLRIDIFVLYQWCVISPFFAKGTNKQNIMHFEFKRDTIMPFCKQPDYPEFPSEYSAVYRVQIHEEHYDFDNLVGGLAAVKQLYTENKAEFRQKIEILKRKVKPEPVFETTVLWVANQCHGIAAGLEKHYAEKWEENAASEEDLQTPTRLLVGGHGGIKPQNLLWFPDPLGEHQGIIRISDFGLAKLSAHTIPAEGKSCVFLEFAAWLLGGWQLVADFAVKRSGYDDILCRFLSAGPTDQFWEIDQDSRSDMVAVRVKQAVTDFITELHTDKNCSEFMHNFLNMIELDMLVVESSKRADCKTIRRRLETLLKACEESPGFETKPAVWEVKPGGKRPGLYSVEISVERKDLYQIIGRLPEDKGQQ
ncbi:hypothetical protein GGR51DRAFT_565091 [Nemania sp. FL0031]|nr:hypothetical protein GGR51DRAFT_565091 [Nemania sp. FL0031]